MFPGQNIEKDGPYDVSFTRHIYFAPSQRARFEVPRWQLFVLHGLGWDAWGLLSTFFAVRHVDRT